MKIFLSGPLAVKVGGVWNYGMMVWSWLANVSNPAIVGSTVYEFFCDKFSSYSSIAATLEAYI